MRILLCSRYADQGASSRVRYLQYRGYFQARGWSLAVSPLFSNNYIRALYTGNPRYREVIFGYLRRLYALTRARKFDVVIIEKELLPFFPAWFEKALFWLRVPYVVDYDDALFHRYDLNKNMVIRAFLGRKIDEVMRHASMVIAGNDYVARRAHMAGAKRVEIIPTVVDTQRYQPVPTRAAGPLVVGWIGTPKTSRYLQSLFPVIDKLKRDMGVRFVAVGARAVDLAGGPWEAWSWSEYTEVRSIQQFDIGIMPLSDSPWERGKCGYKLIQYMACGKPVVASPVGVNAAIVKWGSNGYLATSLDEWYRHLRFLVEDEATRTRMGLNGRNMVMGNYSLQAQAPRLVSAIEHVSGVSQ